MENPFHKIMCNRRAELNLTQGQAGKRAGVARTTWLNWEKVDDMPAMGKWPLIAKALEMPLEDFTNAGVISWFVQCGLSPFQVFALEQDGQPLDERIPAYNFSSPELQALNNELNVDLEPLPGPLAFLMSTLRSQYRRQLIAQDAAQQATTQVVATFQVMYKRLLELSKAANDQPEKKKKIGKVRKKTTAP